MKFKIRILLFFAFSVLLTGCVQNPAGHLQDPISLSGDLAYYGGMDPALRKAALENKHIALSGTVSAEGYTTLFVGEESKDGISFSCTFPDRTDALAAVRSGDAIRLHGVCTVIIGNVVYLEYCQLMDGPLVPSESNPPNSPTTNTATSPIPETTVPPASEPTVPTTSEPTVPTTSEPIVPPASKPTVPPASKPTVPPATEVTVPPTTEPDAPPASEPSDSQLVWIPKSGTKYHSKATCSGMKGPSQVMLEEALRQGYTPCKKCYP